MPRDDETLRHDEGSRGASGSLLPVLRPWPDMCRAALGCLKVLWNEEGGTVAPDQPAVGAPSGLFPFPTFLRGRGLQGELGRLGFSAVARGLRGGGGPTRCGQGLVWPRPRNRALSAGCGQFRGGRGQLEGAVARARSGPGSETALVFTRACARSTFGQGARIRSQGLLPTWPSSSGAASPRSPASPGMARPLDPSAELWARRRRAECRLHGKAQLCSRLDGTSGPRPMQARGDGPSTLPPASESESAREADREYAYPRWRAREPPAPVGRSS